MDAAGVPGLDAAQRAELAEADAAEPFERVARLAAMDLGTPLAAVPITGEFACFAGGSPCAPDMADWQTRAERASESVSRLADGPRRPESFPYGSPDLRRLRAGRYRVFYTIDGRRKLVQIEYVARTT